MAMYIYRTDGCPVGFRFGDFIHDLQGGAAVARVLGSHVYRFDGSYVGELFKDSVVDKPVAIVRRVAAMKRPPAIASPGAGSRRRGIIDYGFADLFDALREDVDEEPLPLAAE